MIFLNTLSFYDTKEVLTEIGAGSSSEVYAVGDTVEITLTDGRTIPFLCVGRYADKTESGAFVPYSFISTQRVLKTTPFQTSTNNQRWGNSNLRTNLASLLDLFPNEWKNRIIPVQKKSSYATSGNGLSETTVDSLWAPAVTELFTDVKSLWDTSLGEENPTYELFVKNNVKSTNNSWKPYAPNWETWTRSVVYSSNSVKAAARMPMGIESNNALSLYNPGSNLHAVVGFCAM